MTIDIKQSTASPIAVDVGNIGVQGRTVSKTVQLAMFTENRNAAWAGRQFLRKASYPFATISFSANRKVFRHEVGDCFKFSYAPYGIANMICRVLQKEEESIESESIIIHAMEDIFSVALAIEEYEEGTDYTQLPPDWTVVPFVHQRVIEAPYAFVTEIKVVPLACRESHFDLAFQLYMSIDSGDSYSLLDSVSNIRAFGTIVTDAYPIGSYPIDKSDTGFIIEFHNDDVGLIDTVTWAEVLAGTKNNALLGDEIITFQTITPVSDYQYRITNIIRGRFDTVRAVHAIGTEFYFIGSNAMSIADAEIAAGAARKFKLVPYNIQQAGDISDAIPIDLTVAGRALKPYIPSNFHANGSSQAARYDTDIILTWSPRYRGRGAGIGIPGQVLAEGWRREGLFEIEVWEGGFLKRTTTDIDAETWTYMAWVNVVDNGGLAATVTFKLLNFRTEDGFVYESDQVQVICRKN